LIDDLSNQKGKLSFTTDVWTSPSSVPFVCVTVHYLNDDWELCSRVMPFRYLPGSHTGLKIGALFEDILKEFDVLDRTLCVTVDNASNNDTFVQYLIKKHIFRDREVPYQMLCSHS
jgi:hypothetical protein